MQEPSPMATLKYGKDDFIATPNGEVRVYNEALMKLGKVNDEL